MILNSVLFFKKTRRGKDIKNELSDASDLDSEHILCVVNDKWGHYDECRPSCLIPSCWAAADQVMLERKNIVA